VCVCVCVCERGRELEKRRERERERESYFSLTVHVKDDMFSTPHRKTDTCTKLAKNGSGRERGTGGQFTPLSKQTRFDSCID